MKLRRVVGKSMEPTLSPGDIVLFKGARLEKLNVGDIVLARTGGLEVVKRIAGFGDGQVWLLGDNPEQSTDSRKHGYVDVANVVARIVLVLRVKKGKLGWSN